MSVHLDLNHEEISETEREVVDNALSIIASKLKCRDQFFNDPDMVKNYLRLRLAMEKRELFVVLFLDSQHRLVVDETVFMGTLDAAPLYCRVVAQKALQYNAAAVVIAHNHPSGVAEPSRADRSITERLSQSLSLLDIRVLDHFVVGYPEVISFAERGWL